LRFCSTTRTAACILAGLMASVTSTTSHAQVAYDKIEVGTMLSASGIALGLFAKPIPLPEGQWEVLSKQEEFLSLTGGRSDSPGNTPRISLILRNTDRQGSPLFAMALHFTPNSLAINWGNQPCTTDNPLGLVDDFGVTPSAMLYACARGDAVPNFRQLVASAPGSANSWVKSTLTSLVPHASDIPVSAVLINVYGNKFRGKSMGVTFMLRADANLDANLAYRSHLQGWMHETGTRWMKVLDNGATPLPGPATYSASK
jgi:hypothetical protein